MSEHTPGPWEAKNPEFGYVVCELTGGWSVVALEADPNKYEPEADARLIAAAPELLEALEMMLDMSEMGEFGKALPEEKAQRAIAKAKGGQG